MANYRVELELVRRGTAKTPGLRTPKVTGVTPDMPIPGQEFTLVTKALDPEAAIRIVTTSPVKSILFQDNQVVKFTTASGSEYCLMILETLPEVQDIIFPKAQA